MAKILIAEDDPTTQKVIVKYVEKMGHVAFVSPNGKHAYESLLACNNFDLLISDIMMPKMDGKKLIRAIRDNFKLCKIPIIIISAVIGITDISYLLEQGATFFLSKPIKKDDLEEYISRCI